MLVRVLLLSLAVLSGVCSADDLALLRLGLEQRQQLDHYLENTACECGCGMTVGYCLREDPACETSPRMAREALNRLLEGASVDSSSSQSGNQSNHQPNHSHSDHVHGAHSSQSYINQSQNGSVVSGTNQDGQHCSYASVGGTTVRLCD